MYSGAQEIHFAYGVSWSVFPPISQLLYLLPGSAEVKQRWKDEGLKNIPHNAKVLTVRYTKRGSIVVPGMSDSHGHILEHGKKLQLDLDGLSTPKGESGQLMLAINWLTYFILFSKIRGCEPSKRIHRSANICFEPSRRLD